MLEGCDTAAITMTATPLTALMTARQVMVAVPPRVPHMVVKKLARMLRARHMVDQPAVMVRQHMVCSCLLQALRLAPSTMGACTIPMPHTPSLPRMLATLCTMAMHTVMETVVMEMARRAQQTAA